MATWPKHPKIYEINTWVWLQELSRKHTRPVTLSTIPGEEWDHLSSSGLDAIWLMGVWERSPAGIAIANQNWGLLEAFRRAIPDFQLEDNVGSPYCVKQYVVDKYLGGPEGLATARSALRDRGLRLILDFVPNHVAPDHPWVLKHPDYFIQGSTDDLKNNPASFMQVDGNVFACGKDPYFPAWPDVLQLNAFNHRLLQEVIRTLSDIAGQCDGVRCDMAMLLLSQVFQNTWGSRAGHNPAVEYWEEVIYVLKKTNPDFLFLAEAYWDLEWELQQEGFDYCYDKRLYDRLEHSDAESIRQHLQADIAYQDKLVRFIENHDEPRAATAFPGEKARAAAVAALTLPGAKLIHEGQSQGLRVRLPVFLGRRPVETIDENLASFYKKLFNGIDHEAFRNGQWRLCEKSGWPDNQSFLNILAWCWLLNGECFLIVLNYQDRSSQARIHIPWDALGKKMWRLSDVLSDEIYDRKGEDMRDNGLYIDLKPWKFHFFRLTAM